MGLDPQKSSRMALRIARGRSKIPRIWVHQRIDDPKIARLAFRTGHDERVGHAMTQPVTWPVAISQRRTVPDHTRRRWHSLIRTVRCWVLSTVYCCSARLTSLRSLLLLLLKNGWSRGSYFFTDFTSKFG